MSDSGGGLSTSTFLTDDETGIKWLKLATTVVGGIFTVNAVGVTAIVNAVVDLPKGGVNWIASFASGLVENIADIPIAAATAAWDTATATIASLSGTWVPIVALAIALTFLYLTQGGAD